MNDLAENVPVVPEADPITPEPESKDIRDKWTLFIWGILDWLVKQWYSIKLLYALIRQPKTLILDEKQAEYVQGLFLGGVNPENIARSVASMYGREAFPYFQIVNEKMDGLTWGAIDFDIQGLELIRASMITLGALTVKKDGDYYETAHPMVKYLSEKIITATMPEPKGAK
jgi:hypothetical protein